MCHHCMNERSMNHPIKLIEKQFIDEGCNGKNEPHILPILIVNKKG